MQLSHVGFGSSISLVLVVAACSGSDPSSAGVEATSGGASATTDRSASDAGALTSGSENQSHATAAASAAGGNTRDAIGGTSSQLGNTAAGGKSAASGGTSSQNGSIRTGGANATGGKGANTGVVSTGGKNANSGVVSTGGKSANSGVVSTGGKSANTGGNAAAAGSPNVAADCRKEGDNKTTLVFVNHCAQTVTYRGSDIAGGTVAPDASVCVDVGNASDAISSKRYWGYVGADPGAEHHSLAEFTFNTDFYDMDWYNISYVDAFNLPLAILPSARPKCRQLICPQDFLAACPAEGQYRDSNGEVVSCVSPNRDDPNGPVVQLFEQCNDAYAWSGDDQKGSDPSPMIGCEVEDFEIVFCPKG